MNAPSASSPVRPVTIRDLPALATLEAAAFPHPWPEKGLRAQVFTGDSLALAIGDGELRAYALFRRILEEAELLRIAVHPRHQRQGLATRLLRRGLEQLHGAGVERCHLEVRGDNRSALALYRGHGFVGVGRRGGYYPDGMDAVLMACDLPFQPSPSSMAPARTPSTK